MFDLPLFLAQIVAVLVAARLVGRIFRLLHQPQVVGEMTAGILLGPSFLGWVAPDLSAALFPASSLGFINALSQVGLLIFMFLVGLELDTRTLRSLGRVAMITSHAGMVAPFLLGSALALYLYPRLADDSVSFLGFALFMGASMSVTAFPVLARILMERRLTRTRVGTISLACAAVGDVTAWCVLAGVVVIVRASDAAIPLWLTVIGTVAYIGVVLLGVGPILRRRLVVLFGRRGQVTQSMLSMILLITFGSAWVTESLGIHALFGAFLIGLVMPKDGTIDHQLAEKLGDLTLVLLMPLFFAYTGLRTTFGLVSGLELWMLTTVIILVAVAGKFGGSFVASRAAGLPWREAGAVGVLMNTRGLVELVILNVGYDLGVLSPTLFAIMVLMALVTTLMTTPLLQLIYSPRGVLGASADGRAPIDLHAPVAGEP